MDLFALLYLSDLVKYKSVNTRLTDDSLLLVMSTNSKGSSNTFFERSIIYAPPTKSNKLNGRIRKIMNFASCKREIKQSYF